MEKVLSFLASQIQQTIGGFKRFIAFERFHNPTEFLMFAYMLFIGLGFLYFDVSFAKAGIPISLPAFMGNIPFQNVKLFNFEIFFIFCFLAALSNISAWRGKFKKIGLNSMHTGLGIVILFSLIRLIPDFFHNPILGIRNSAFCWYLFVPIFLWLSPIKVAVLETMARLVHIGAYVVFLISLFEIVSTIEILPLPEWVPFVSVYFVFAAVLHSKSLVSALIVLAPIGLGLGINVYAKFQRTTLMGLIILVSTLFLYHLIRKSEYRLLFARGLAILGVFIFLGYVLWPNKSLLDAAMAPKKEGVTKKYNVVVDPLKKGEHTKGGLERFRLFMWQDAYRLFKENPWVGVGFQRPVVERYYMGGGTYWKNDGSHIHRTTPTHGAMVPAISGPHNSYLNAIARIGVFGVLFLFIHIYSFFLLLKRKYYGLALLIFAQGLYAMFNVGLEGPARSAMLLIALSAALKLSPQLDFWSSWSASRRNKQGLVMG